jgi:protein TonB
MKRCPHCGQQDNEDAIICKHCMRYFSAPASAPVVGAKTTSGVPSGAPTTNRRARKKERQERAQQKRPSLVGALARLVVLGAVGLYVTQNWPDLAERIDTLLRSTLDPARTAVADEPAAATALPEPSPEPEPPAEPAPVVPTPVADSTPPVPEPSAEAPPVEAPAARTPVRPVAPAPKAAAKAPARTPPEPPSAPDPPPPARDPDPPARAEAEASRPAGGQPVRVGGNIKAPRKTRDKTPDYPPAARAARVQGIVIIEAVIDTGGKVSQTRVLRSVPMLDEAAVDAVKQWEYEPTLLNGVKVPVIMTVTVRFGLQ